ncbi:MAG: hypothetical protein ACHBN1_26785 [Heteroscytonema crispum UTEX LB 1556]
MASGLYNNQQPFGFTIPGTRENATCSTWGDPKTAVAPLPRAPLHQHPTTNTQHPTPNTQHPTPNNQHPTTNNK